MTITYKDYQVSVDDYNYTLRRKMVHKKTKEVYYAEDGFYSKLENVLRRIARIETAKGEDTMELSEYIKQACDTYNEFSKELEKLRVE